MEGSQLTVIVNYFRALNISSLSLMMCISEETKTLTLGKISYEGFQVGFGLSNNSAGTVIDLDCNDKVVEHMEGEWLIFGTAKGASKLPVLPDTRATLVSGGEFFDIYKPSMSSSLRMTKYVIHRDHSDLQGVTLKAVTVEEQNYYGDNAEDIFRDYGCLTKQEGGWSPKMSEVLVENLAQQLNFKILKKKVEGCKSIYIELSERKVDFSATAIMMSHERMEYSEFTGDLYEHRSMILYKQPGLSVVRNIYLLPFHKYVWFSCGALFTLCFTLLLTATLIYPGSFEEYTYSTSIDLLTLLIGIASQQGINLGAASISTRMCLLLFSISSLFLYTSYSANIVSLLQSTAETVTSITGLTSSPLKVAVQDRPYNKIYLQESSGEVKELYENKIKIGPEPFITAEDGVKKIKSELFAFQVETSLAYQLMSNTYTEKEKCGLAEIHVYTFPRYSIPVIKSSGYRELFASRLRRQMECGLISWSEKRSLNRKPSCTASDSGFISVTFDDFFPGLMVLCWGFAAAISAFLAEVVSSKYSLINFNKINKFK